MAWRLFLIKGALHALSLCGSHEAIQAVNHHTNLKPPPQLTVLPFGNLRCSLLSEGVVSVGANAECPSICRPMHWDWPTWSQLCGSCVFARMQTVVVELT